MNEKKYKYNRNDFKPLPVTLEHLDISLNFVDEKVNATNTLRMTARETLESISLDAHDLQINSVELICQKTDDGEQMTDLEYVFKQDEHKLIITLPEKIDAGTTFSIRTKTTCVPSDNILEGVYKDTTPAGCPQQYISQCEQWGFQRIMPIFDNCTAKCTMTTTIEADARYTHLISNGNISKETNPEGKPAPKADDPSRQVITYVNEVPIAPYLFVVCAGTWDVLEDEVTYPSGKNIKLEYLIPHGRKEGAVLPMRILKDSVLWQNKTQNYEYKYDVYRTICMEKSNFGGMENVGNTTIITEAALIDAYINDARLEYAYGIIIHEFEHNQCGSDVTMETPFDMWLNEAFTVDVERQYSENIFDPDFTRLGDVDSMRAPNTGPLSIEDGGHMGNIVREGFNNPDELVDGLTYVKAAEVINMLKLILGKETFRECKNLYFTRYDGKNANTDQFFECFEEISKRDLSQFKKEWLFTIGYPKVEASYSYNDSTKKLSLTLKQTRSSKGGLFHLPVEIAVVDGSGNDIPGTAQVVEITGETTELSLEDIPAGSFISLNRNCSFYGTFTDKSSTHEILAKQVKLDPNGFNKVEAMRRLTDIERIKLVKNIDSEISQEWLETFLAVLKNQSVSAGLKSYLLRIEEQSMDRDLTPYYRERYEARQRLLKAASSNHMPELLEAYNSIDTYAPALEPKDGIEERRLKAVLLSIISAADTPETHELAEQHMRKAWSVTDKISALRCIWTSDHPNRVEIMNEMHELWRDHLSAYSSYLTILGSGVTDNVFDEIKKEEHRSTFKIEHPTHCRALFLPMSHNNKMLWTDKGIEWLTETAIRLAPINELSTSRLIASFQLVHKLPDNLKAKVISALEKMRDNIDKDKCPWVAGKINAYLQES